MLLIALSSAPGCTMLSAPQYKRLSPPLDELDSGAIEDIGRHYLKQFPQDQEVGVVMDILTSVEQPGERKIDQLRHLMLADFESDQTVNLYGWIVSRTEGRVFAAGAEILRQ